MIVGTAAIISLGFMLFAFVQKIQADRQTEIAKQQKGGDGRPIPIISTTSASWSNPLR